MRRVKSKQLILLTVLLFALFNPGLSFGSIIDVVNCDFTVDGISYRKITSESVYVSFIRYTVYGASDTGTGQFGRDFDVYNNYSGAVTIPSSVIYDGITYSVTGISTYAFYSCSVESVTIPESVVSIGTEAFYMCNRLKRINIPKSVGWIGNDAFFGCSALESITVDSNNENYDSRGNCNALIETSSNTLLKGCDNTIIPNSITSIGDFAFYNCSSLASVNIPNSVSYIGGYAFSGCNSLASVNISNSVIVKVIEEGTFYNCTSLTSVSFPNSITSIGDYAFYNCSSLASVNIPNSVAYIGESAFWGTPWYYNQPDGLIYIGMVAYNYKGTMPEGASIEIREGTKGIAAYAFNGCSGLTSLTIPQSVTSIGYNAFNNCSGLSTLNWNAINCTTNGDMTTSNLSQINIGNRVQTLPAGFATESKITSITMPETVTSIGNYAFSGCTGLSSITIPDAVTSFGEYAFSGCTGLKTVYYNATNCSDFNSPLYNCPIEQIVIGDNVTTIPQYFAYNLTGLTSITIPDAVTSIGNYAFSGCTGLSSITIPDAVTSIGNSAFSGCTGLKSVICWPITPPSLGYSAFSEVSSDMCVYVRDLSLEAYQSNYNWRYLTILPFSDFSKVVNLTVNMPANVDCSTYANMVLAITNTQDDRTNHFVMTDKNSYVFGGIDFNTTWNVTLANQYGDAFGKIENVQVGEENVSVTFSSLLKPQDVTLTVKTPDGQDVTSQCKISWMDENGELLTQGNPIKKLPAGRKLKYQVSLPQELATAYTLPATNTYTVKSSSNNVVCQLTAISQAQLNGKVMDASNNQPLYGATISAIQSFGGNNTKTLTARTDNQGQYSLDASSVPTTLTVAATGYISQTVDCDMASGSTVTVPDVALSPITGAVVNVNLTFTPAHLQSEPADVQNWYSDYGNVDYVVYNKTTGRTISNISVQYPQIVLMEDVSDGDVLELTATSRSDAFNPVKATVTIAEQKATATFNILEKGKVSAKFNKNINPQVVGILYDEENKMVKSNNYAGDALTIDDLADGNYKLITMGKSEFFNAIYDLEQFAAAGLQSGVDYAENTVTATNGLITPVSINEVPYFDETKFYYTGEGTSFSVNKPNIVIGNYLTFRGKIDFKEQYASQVNDIQLIVDLPESCHFYENSVMVGASMGGYTINGNQIIIPIVNTDDVVRFCAIPTVPGDFSPSAFVQFKLNGKTITQPIGQAPFTPKGLSISVPSISADTTIHVNGSGYASALVKIYDGKIQIGQTQCRADGNWSASVNLYKPYSHSYHHIHAEIEIVQDLTLLSESKLVEYDKNAPQLQSITMYTYNSSVMFDHITGSTVPPYYNVSSNNYSFIARFNKNDTSLIKNLEFTVLSEDGNIRNVDGYFVGASNGWIATLHAYSSHLSPINVTAEFDIVNNSPNVDTAMVVASSEWENSIIRRFVESLESADTRITIVNDKEFMAVVKLPSNDSICLVVKEVPLNSISDLESNGYHFQDLNSDIWISPSIDTENSIYLWNSDGSYLITFIDYNHNDYNEHNNKILAPPRNPLQRIIAFINGSPFFGDNNHVHGIDYYEFLLFDWYPAKCNQFYSNLQRLNNLIYATCPDGSLKLDKYYIDLYQIGWDLYNLKCEEFRSEIKSALENYREKIDNRHAINVAMQLLSLGLSLNGVGGVVFNTWINSSLPRASIAFFAESFATNYFANAISDLDEGAIEGFSAEEKLWNICYNKSKELEDSFINLKRRIVSSYKQCGEKEIPDFSEFFCPPVTPNHDPSGFVYEGVPSNRLQGVTATCYYKETVEDMYGDEHEEVVLWDAEQYGQQNPLLTDENGFYRWDVPIGMWQVKYEKEGYETTYSDWLPVPPPQLDVNIGMVQMRQPEVIKARAYNQAVELEFDKYMLPEDMTTQNIKVFDQYGHEVSGSIELLNAELDDPTAITSIRRAPGTGLTFASKVRFNTDHICYNSVTLRVNNRVRSYAGLEMGEDYEVTLPVEYEMEKIVADSTINILYGDSRKLKISVQRPYAARNKTLTVRSVSPMIATTDAETYKLNNNGEVMITVHGDLPGQTSLVYTIDGYDLMASTVVNVMMESQMTVATPTASIASGSVVDKGIAVYLRCATSGATIYYTLDGSCPCDPSPARKVYDGSPIIIDGTVTIKAMATAPDLYDSEVATFVYRVGNGIKGDVNGDGEVNIADVNAVIDIILGGTVDADTRDRADVNGDGEINIADINAIIDIILNPVNSMSPVVNCNDLLNLDDVTMRPGDVRTLQVTVDHATRYSAMQCDIVLPAGLTLVDAQAMGANTMRTGSVNDTTCRITNYSMSKLPFAGDSQPVMTFTVRADAALALESEITLTNVVLADATNKAWRTADCTARVNNASGINDMTATAGRVWVEKRTLCIEARHDGIARIITVNGMTSDLTVKAGITRHDMEPGIYIVVLDGHSYKIAIK